MGGTREILTQPRYALHPLADVTERVLGVAGMGVAFPAAVPLGLPGVPGSFRGCRDLLAAAELPEIQVRPGHAPAAFGAPAGQHRGGGEVPGPAGAGAARRYRRRCGPGSPPPSAGRPPRAPARGDRRPGAGSPPAGTPRRAGGSASRRTARASPPHRRADPRSARGRPVPRRHRHRGRPGRPARSPQLTQRRVSSPRPAAATIWCTREDESRAAAASARMDTPSARADASAQLRSRSASSGRHARDTRSSTPTFPSPRGRPLRDLYAHHLSYVRCSAEWTRWRFR